MVTRSSTQNLPTHGFLGIISDTHGLVRPKALEILQGADFIIHAGDNGNPEILERLEEVAPVVVVRGNNDSWSWAQDIPDIHVISTRQGQIWILHNIKDLDLATVSSKCFFVVSGHSHQPSIHHSQGKTLLNPGSAGPRRFTLPISLARLHIFPQGCRPELMTIAG